MLKTSTARIAWQIYTQKLTLAGRWFLFPTIMFASYGAVSLVIQGYVVFSYLFAVWLLALAGMLFFRPKVKLTALYAPRVCAGQTLNVDLEIEQLARLSQIELVALPHRLPQAVDAQPDEGVVLPTLRYGQRTKVRLGLLCKRRGVFHLQGFRVESGFPFGLLRGSRVFHQTSPLIVYPRFEPLGRLDLPTGVRHHPGGVALASNLGESFEFIGNRDYREGDNIRDIDWKATARLGRPIVREYREEYFMRVAVILDTHLPPKSPPADEENFERAVSVTASVADYMARQDYLVDIFAAGPNLYHLTAGRSLAYLDQILDILAAIEANPIEPFAVIEPQLMHNLGRITTIICVFMDWDHTRREFVARLAAMGCGVRVILVREGKTTLDTGEDIGLATFSPVVTRAMYEAGLEQL